MVRIFVGLILAVSASVAISCEKISNPSIDCWNPPDEQVEEGLSRFYSVGDEIREALFANDSAAAVRLANEYLSLAAIYRNNWNHGNALHDANVALGVVALREKNMKLAASHLLEAGKSPGSPQLNTFGPDLSLANALLKAGEEAAVVEYLRSVCTFWESGQKSLPAVISRIEKGEKPSLNQYLLLDDGR